MSRVSRGLVLLVTAVVLAQSLVTWGFNYWQKDFIDALSNKQAQAFFFSLQLLGVIILVQMFLSWLDDTFQPKLTNQLRAVRFNQLAGLYFAEQRFLTGTQMTAAAPHDPAQRLVDDLREWAGLVVQLSGGAFGTVIKLVLFSYTLCQVLPQLPFFGITVPFPMLILALVSFGLSAGVIHWLGRRLPVRETERSNREANLRTHVAHMQPQAAAIALLRGAAVEQTLAQTKLNKVFDAVRSLATIQARVGAFAILFGPSPSLRAQAEQALHALNLSAWLARLDESADWGSQLSGGEQALAGLIRAWLQASDWVLMDEPNAALDPASAERFWRWVQTWQDRTIVIISHQPIPGDLGFRQVDW